MTFCLLSWIDDRQKRLEARVGFEPTSDGFYNDPGSGDV